MELPLPVGAALPLWGTVGYYRLLTAQGAKGHIQLVHPSQRRLVSGGGVAANWCDLSLGVIGGWRPSFNVPYYTRFSKIVKTRKGPDRPAKN